MIWHRAIAILFLLSANAFAAPPPAASDSYGGLFTKLADVPLGERTSRFDYESLDPASGRLAISKMGSGKLLIFDVRSRSLVSELDGFPKTTGVLMVPALQRIYASVPGAGLSASLSVAFGLAGMGKGTGAVAILDSVTLKEIARLPGGVFPDGIAYDPKERRIFVSDELGGALTVIDADANTILARIDTGGEVGNVQFDPVSKTVYVPVQSHDELIAVDPVSLQVLARHTLAGCRHSHGLHLADGRAIGFVACDENDRLLAVDLISGRVLADLPVAHDPDVLAADPAAKRLYVASESGLLSVIGTSDPEKPILLGTVKAGGNAHSVAVDPLTHQLFLPLRDLNGKAAMRILAPRL